MQNVQTMNMQFAQQFNQWKRTGKKKYEIWFSVPDIVVTMHNDFEDVDYTAGNGEALLSGTAGEPWSTKLEKIAKTYVFATGEAITPESLARHKQKSPDGWMKIATQSGAMTNYAMFLDKNKYRNVPIAAWGCILWANRDGIKHGDGDYLVCGMNQDGSPNFNDMWVVNGCVFVATYNCQNFALSPKAKQASAASAPRPSVNVKGTPLLEYKPYVEQIVTSIQRTGKLKPTSINHDTDTQAKRDGYGGCDCWQVYFGNKDLYLHIAFLEKDERESKNGDMWIQCHGTAKHNEYYYNYEHIASGTITYFVLSCFGLE